MTNQNLYFAKTNPFAIVPSKKSEDMGYDFYPCFDHDYLIIQPFQTVMIPTGIACAMSEDYGLIIKERGSIGSLGLTCHCGVVDSGYRGEIFIAMQNCNDYPVRIDKSVEQIYTNKDFGTFIPYTKAIAQGIIVQVPKMNLSVIPYEDLKQITSERGCGKLGSSKK